MPTSEQGVWELLRHPSRWPASLPQLGTDETVVPASIADDASGTPHQGHLFYAVNDAAWWLVWPHPTNGSIIHTARSTDLLTWTNKSGFTLAHSLKIGAAAGHGYHLAVAYRSISGTDVVHITTAWNSNPNRGIDHVRATISGTTISFGAQAAVSSSTQSGADTDAIANLIDSNGRVQIIASDMSTDFGNAEGYRSTNTDSGAAWTAGFDAPVRIFGGVSATVAFSAVDLGGGVTLALCDDSGGAGETANNIEFGLSSATGVWTSFSAATALAASTTAAFSAYDWGAVARTTTDVHLVVRDPDNANAFLHRRFNGTAWSAGASVPTQASKAGAGVFLASDGVDVWLFVVDSAASNAVRYAKWSSAGGTWGAWADLETSTQARTALSGCRSSGLVGGAATLGICWTEAVGGLPFRVVTKPLPLATGQSVTLGQPAETDLALPLGRAKVRTLAQVVEADLAQPLSRAKARLLGQPSETDTAQALGRAKARTLGQPTEADTAQPLGRAKARTLGQASETDTAQPLTRAKRRTLGQPGETDQALPLTRVKRRLLGLAAETDLAQLLGRVKRRLLGQPAEADLALPVTASGPKRVTLNQIVETDQALPLGKVKVRTLALAAETDAALALRRLKVRTLGQPAEADLALALVAPAPAAAARDPWIARAGGDPWAAPGPATDPWTGRPGDPWAGGPAGDPWTGRPTGDPWDGGVG